MSIYYKLNTCGHGSIKLMVLGCCQIKSVIAIARLNFRNNIMGMQQSPKLINY